MKLSEASSPTATAPAGIQAPPDQAEELPRVEPVEGRRGGRRRVQDHQVEPARRAAQVLNAISRHDPQPQIRQPVPIFRRQQGPDPPRVLRVQDHQGDAPDRVIEHALGLPLHPPADQEHVPGLEALVQAQVDAPGHLEGIRKRAGQQPVGVDGVLPLPLAHGQLLVPRVGPDRQPLPGRQGLPVGPRQEPVQSIHRAQQEGRGQEQRRGGGNDPAPPQPALPQDGFRQERRRPGQQADPEDGHGGDPPRPNEGVEQPTRQAAGRFQPVRPARRGSGPPPVSRPAAAAVISGKARPTRREHGKAHRASAGRACGRLSRRPGATPSHVRTVRMPATPARPAPGNARTATGATIRATPVLRPTQPAQEVRRRRCRRTRRRTPWPAGARCPGTRPGRRAAGPVGRPGRRSPAARAKRLRIADCGLRIQDCELRIANCELFNCS